MQAAVLLLKVLEGLRRCHLPAKASFFLCSEAVTGPGDARNYAAWKPVHVTSFHRFHLAVHAYIHTHAHVHRIEQVVCICVYVYCIFDLCPYFPYGCQFTAMFKHTQQILEYRHIPQPLGP